MLRFQEINTNQLHSQLSYLQLNQSWILVSRIFLPYLALTRESKIIPRVSSREWETNTPTRRFDAEAFRRHQCCAWCSMHSKHLAPVMSKNYQPIINKLDICIYIYLHSMMFDLTLLNGSCPWKVCLNIGYPGSKVFYCYHHPVESSHTLGHIPHLRNHKTILSKPGDDDA